MFLRREMTLTLATMITVLAIMVTGALADDVWPMHQMNPKHTGRSPHRGPKSPTIRWTYQTDGEVACSPAIGPDSIVYLGTYAGTFYAIDSDGTLHWTYDAPGGGFYYSDPAVAQDGTLYVGGERDHKFYAINSDSTLKWSYTTGDRVCSAPSIGADGTVYVGSVDNRLYAFNPDGTVKWSFTAACDVDASPALAADGTIYISSYYSGGLYAINPDGTQKWKISESNMGWATVTIDEEGILYVPTGYNGHVWSVDPADGSIIWDYNVGVRVHTSLALGEDGVVYVGDYNGKVSALWPDGSLKWSYDTGESHASSPIIDDDGVVFFCTRNGDDGTAWAIEPDGTLLWSLEIAGRVGWMLGPSLGEDGTLYCVNPDGVLYAIGDYPVSYYVNGDSGSDSYDGMRPTYDGTHGPWQTITHALDTVSGSEAEPVTIHVAAGTYAASTPPYNGETFPLYMESWVSLLGENRDTTILDAEDDAYHVIYCDTVNDLTIEGFTITGGRADSTSAPDKTGGGIYCAWSCSVSIQNNTIISNTARYKGGGIFCAACDYLTITNNTITSNLVTESSSPYSYGGGIYLGSSGPATISHNVISENTSGAEGAGICCYLSSPSIENNTITHNCAERHGGGISCFAYSNPTITGNNIIHNEASGSAYCYGGGIYCYQSSPTIDSNTIAENVAEMCGAGIGCLDNSSPMIEKNQITGNSVERSSGAGGGIYCNEESSPTIRSNEITGNSGGICCEYSSPTVENNIIAGNVAEIYGGGIYCYQSSPTIHSNQITSNSIERSCGAGAGICCLDNSSPTITNNIIKQNQATGEKYGDGDTEGAGGGIYCSKGGTGSGYAPSSPIIRNCTLADNSASNANGGGAVYADTDCEPEVKNSILWGNSPDEIAGPGSVTVTYSDVQGGWAGTGNIDNDPRFCSRGGETNYDGYFLKQENDGAGWPEAQWSLCIDAGDPSSDPFGGADNEEYSTAVNGFLDINTVDMGYHYEYHGCTYIELVSFEARPHGSSIVLRWQTGAEIDNAGFLIYRAIAGASDYVQVGDLIAAEGTAASGASYRFVDRNVEAGVSYDYWLVDVDTSGKWTAHGPVSATLGGLRGWPSQPKLFTSLMNGNLTTKSVPLPRRE
ncbi:MAG TPA: PQQ-binding-like beta-propeller repeat protein [bacterium]|nr:PQQ-binding-like beta-propeller repeat protein [bacterium]